MSFSTRLLPALALSLVLGLVLVACGQESPTPSPTETPSPTATPTAAPTPPPTEVETPSTDAPEGWKRIAVPDRGFSLIVPEAWEELSPDLLGDSGVIEEMLESNPDAAAVIEQARAAIAGGQIALFAFDAGSDFSADFAANLNAINVGPAAGTAQDTADEVAKAIREQIPITGDVEVDTVTLDAGEAALLRYEWEIADAQGSTIAVTVTQYAILGHSGTGFILSLSAASDTVAEYEETFRLIAESFREEPS